MNLTCYLIQRKLANEAITPLHDNSNASIERHIARCQPCRDRLELLQSLGNELRDCLSAPQPSSGFGDVTWDRLMAAAPTRPRFGALALTFGASVLLLAVIALTTRTGWYQQSSAPTAIARSTETTKPNISRVAANNLRVETTHSKIPTVSPRLRHAPRARKRMDTSIRRSIRRPNIRRQLLARDTAVSNVAKPVSKMLSSVSASSTRTATWTQWAAWYESYGDYRSAEAAYAAALAVKPDPALEFHAGRAAECAGDVAQAVDYYSRILKQEPRDQAGPKKGSMLWNEKHDSA